MVEVRGEREGKEVEYLGRRWRDCHGMDGMMGTARCTLHDQ